jgi:SAM-dependent methyltransferase
MSGTRRFTEEDIRPKRLMGDQASCKEEDRQFLLAHRREFVEVSCPACGGKESRPYFSKKDFDYQECPACGTVYVSPRPSPALLEKFFEVSKNYGYWNRHIFPASEDVRRERIFRPRAERVRELVRKYLRDARVLLEVGAGFGTFCEEMAGLGFFDKILAIEPSVELAQTCRERGLDVIPSTVEKADLKGVAVDVAVSFEVIEHLFSPMDFVRECGELLCEGGLLILTCPNLRGLDLQVLGDKAGTFDYEHLNYFHPDSLSLLMSRAGFETLETLTPGELDCDIVRKAALAGEVSLDNQPFLNDVIVKGDEKLREAFQEFLRAAKLSSHMWLAARKDTMGRREK